MARQASPAVASAQTPRPTYDLLVVGGGINGAGIARDAALRGLKVCLVEKEDWGWGTSAKSSKLAHGGLRYLEQLEFGLVHEALQDREIMFSQAPHLVRPLRFLYPIYPHIAARRVVRVGLFLYDVLSHGKSVPGRDYLRAEQVLQEVPGLNPEGLRGGAVYYDGQIRHVERLVIELVQDARAHGARCIDHAAVKEILIAPNATPEGEERGRASLRVTGVKVRHRGAHGAGDAGEASRAGAAAWMQAGAGTRHEVIHARTIVNAAGAWVDDVLGPLAAGRPPKVRKTKGVHIVVPKFVDTALIIRSAADGRTFFILPWEDACVVGTTDTDYEGDAADAAATPEEVRYLQESARRYFPDAPLDQVRYTYAGVRALVNQEGLTESNVTRRHILYDHEEEEGIHGLWSLQGGKITTYRSLAEETVDQVCEVLGRRDLRKLHPTRTARLPGTPAVGWQSYRADMVRLLTRDHHIPLAGAENLLDLYGAQWKAVLTCDERPEARQPVHPDVPDLACQVTYAVRIEDARTVADVMLRRTMMGLAADGRTAVAEAVATWMGGLLGWDGKRRRRELEAYEEAVRVLHIPTADP